MWVLGYRCRRGAYFYAALMFVFSSFSFVFSPAVSPEYGCRTSHGLDGFGYLFVDPLILVSPVESL